MMCKVKKQKKKLNIKAKPVSQTVSKSMTGKRSNCCNN